MSIGAGSRSLVTGVEGQDGWYLAQQLLDAGVEVLGTARSSDSVAQDHPLILGGGSLAVADVTDAPSIQSVVREFGPDHVFHLAGFSSAGRSWASPVECLAVNTGGLANVIEAIETLRSGPGGPRLVFASSAEIFDIRATLPYSERTALGPRNPYGVSKAAAHQLVQAYRAHGQNCANAVLFNHESPRRTEAFVTGRIVAGVARIHLGQTDTFTLGNLEARRDWCFAGDVARALIAIASAPWPDDWVVASGVSRSVAEFAAAAFAAVGIDDWRQHVTINPELLRTGDAPEQRGDATKIRAELGWTARTPFETWIAEMVARAIERVRP